jgi:hypothetical protein
MNRLILIISIIILTFNLNAQDSIQNRFSYSIAWTPIYYGPNDGRFRIDAVIPINFDVKVHYRLIKNISISSGIGFQGRSKTYSNWLYLSYFDPSLSEKWNNKTLKLPLQVNCFLKSENDKIKPFLKSEFVYESNYTSVSQYQGDELINSYSYHFNSSTMDFGFGTLIRINNSFKILTEGSIGTRIINDPFDGYQIRLKLGIMIK